MRPIHLIKLSATDSTNAELRRRLQLEDLPDLTVVWTLEQTQGRGQRGAAWASEKGKNLTFSILKRFESLAAADHFLINILVSNALISSLQTFKIPDLSIKWPNDILSGGKKICGILPENSLTGDRITSSIIGIGLNVNQVDFEGLPRAGSLKSACERHFDLEDVFLRTYSSLSTALARSDSSYFREQRAAYQKNLFGLGQNRKFRSDAASFEGKVAGVDQQGRLLVEKSHGITESYDLKEIVFLY